MFYQHNGNAAVSNHLLMYKFTSLFLLKGAPLFAFTAPVPSTFCKLAVYPVLGIYSFCPVSSFSRNLQQKNHAVVGTSRAKVQSSCALGGGRKSLSNLRSLTRKLVANEAFLL